MKVSFKPLSLAIAVSAAAAGYAGTINAQATLAGNTSIGDLAIVPYYTVREDWTTGVSVINTSERTQVVKVRLRRATDSMDVLDFNIVMSPNDVWTGYLENNTAPGEEDQMRFYSDDKSCTAPRLTANANGAPYFTVPAVFADFAEEGYIEFIGMGSTETELAPIAIMALHKPDGIPLDCALLQQNFKRFGNINQYFDNLTVDAIDFTGDLTDNGVVNSTQTVAEGFASNYEKAGNFMKVSWNIKDTTTGIEMGDNAVMIEDFLDGPSITNQVRQVTLDTEDLQGYDYPDLNGGAPLSAGEPVGTVPVIGTTINGADIDVYGDIRAELGGRNAINEWSKNVQADVTVNTDWVITVPGQYTMLDLPLYLASISGDDAFDPTSKEANPGCLRGPVVPVVADPTATPPVVAAARGCDFRDLPLTITPVVYNREELEEEIEDDEIVISPTPPSDVKTNELYYEVNVIQWGDTPVLEAAASTTITVDLDGAVFGWAALAMESSDAGVLGVCAYDVTPSAGVVTNGDLVCANVGGDAPIVGFAAWERNFTRNPDANYGRAIGHGYDD